MARKIAKYTLPRTEEARDTLAHSVLTYAAPHRAHWETSSGVKGPWAMASAEVP
ncbi:MAG: hypothetical protein LBS64_01340 [Spirochaetaceae bacterium]|jgi:hypothetical protein|nr:hypothetical protein [Spirochaetaceae bacterium]